MANTMHFAWAGGSLPADGGETVFGWHVRNPDHQIFIWFKPGPSVQAARQTFGAHPHIHISECDGSVRAADGSVRPAVTGLLLPAVQGGLAPAVQGARLSAVQGALPSAVRGELLPAVRGELLPAVRGELLPAVQQGRLTMIETNGVWGDGSEPPQAILIGLNRA